MPKKGCRANEQKCVPTRGLHYPFDWGAEDRLLTTYSWAAPSMDDSARGRPVVKDRSPHCWSLYKDTPRVLFSAVRRK